MTADNRRVHSKFAADDAEVGNVAQDADHAKKGGHDEIGAAVADVDDVEKEKGDDGEKEKGDDGEKEKGDDGEKEKGDDGEKEKDDDREMEDDDNEDDNGDEDHADVDPANANAPVVEESILLQRRMASAAERLAT